MSENRQVSVGKTDRSVREQFGMLPKSVMARKDITAGAKMLLLAMNMESFGTGRLAVSDGILAEVSGVSRGQIVELRKSLETAVLIAKEGNPMKQVQAYRLLHPDMQGFSDGVALVTKTNRVARKAKIEPCLKCEKPCVRSKADGLCRRCINDNRIRGIARQEIRLDKRESA